MEPKNSSEYELKKLKDNCDKFIDYGNQEQKKANDIVRNASSLKKFAEFIESDTDLKNQESTMEWARAVNASGDGMIPIMYKVSNFTDIIGTVVTTSATTAGSYVFSMIDTGRVKDKVLENLTALREAPLRELDQYLEQFRKQKQISTDLVSRRKGAWTALHSPSEDKLSQASNSIRDVLRLIINTLASDEQIEKAEWYKKTSQGISKKKPNNNDKIRFLLFGSNEKYDENILKMVSVPYDVLHQKFEKLQSVAHGSSSNDKEVGNCMIAAEDLMLSIFKARELRPPL